MAIYILYIPDHLLRSLITVSNNRTRTKRILSKIDQKLDGLQKDIVELKIGQTEIKGEIKTLSERINGVDKRVKNQDFISRGILVSLILAILGGLAKLFGFVGNP